MVMTKLIIGRMDTGLAIIIFVVSFIVGFLGASLYIRLCV